MIKDSRIIKCDKCGRDILKPDNPFYISICMCGATVKYEVRNID